MQSELGLKNGPPYRVYVHVLIMVLVLSGCTTTLDQDAPQPRTTMPHMQETDLRDSVSKEEAQSLAAKYYHDHYGQSEGGVSYVGENETHWLFEVVTGAAAVDEGTVRINKKGGIVSFEPK